MPFANKVAIAIDLNESPKESFASLKELDFITNCEIHLVNIYQTTIYAIGLGEGSIIYPIESDQKKIQESAVAHMEQLSKDLLPTKFSGKIVTTCLFSDAPRRKFCEYINENNMDTIIVGMREKRGFFEGSFTQYVTKHTKANLIILKH